VTREEAKQILMLYRPGTADADEPDLQQAMDMARADADLGAWFEQHRAFNQTIRSQLRGIQAPPHIKAAILAHRKIVPLPRPWWQQPGWVAAAACLALLCLAVGFSSWLPLSQRLSNFQHRMVGSALREYSMDLVTRDQAELRRFIAGKGAPADYELPQGLEKLKLSGGGMLHWRTNPVTMVCLERPNKKMLYLFVLKRGALKDPPPDSPQLTNISEHPVASWTKGENAYVLASEDETDVLTQYF
jgi:hypothetical protein